MHRIVDQTGKDTEMTFEKIARYGSDAKFEPLESKSAGEELDRKIRKLRAENPRLSYTECYYAALQSPDNAELKVRFAREG
jgi:hypothetical protein